MSDEIDMIPDLTPEEEADAVELYREKLKQLKALPAPTDPGEFRTRRDEEQDLGKRIKDYEDRISTSESED